ncbi:MAG: putative glycoside hydrolase [Patescibacteria group bacterium]
MRSRLGQICAGAIGLALALSPFTARATGGIQGSPKIINLFLNWQLTESDVQALSKWDVVVLDYDQEARYPDRIRELHSLNPSIKILAYIQSEEIPDARFSEPPEYPGAKLSSSIDQAWYVHDASGNKTSFWPGTSLLNVTDLGPTAASGERWNQFLPTFIHDQILSTGLWDGVFLDNTFDGISHYAKSPVDLNRDGKADAAADADAAWQAGMREMIARVVQGSPSAIVMGNGGFVYSNQLNGAFFENFPSYTWASNWQDFRTSISKNRAPSYTGMNVNPNNADLPADYQLMRYGLANALVGGGYYSFDQGDQNHNDTWWYDEYNTPLGTPTDTAHALIGGKGSTVVPAVWGRDFKNGLVLLNSTSASQTVPLPGVFEKLHGTQDPKQNNGSLVTSVQLASHDGILLIRQSNATEIRGGAFVNGSFVRAYDNVGRQPQNGFFAQRSDVPSGATTEVTDVDSDGKDDVVAAAKGVVTIHFGSGKTTSFSPFGKSYTGTLNIAIGNVNRDAQQEIVVGRGSGTPAQVAIFSMAGKMLTSWSAYSAPFSGGVRIAIGDIDHDGLNEIVTGAGPGGGPHIRIWKTDGTPWGGSFFAFDQSEHGGVSVAMGDVDGDGKDEIIVGSGQGAMPKVRIFSGSGTLKAEFTLGAQPLVGGLTVTAADINGDGIAEILVSGLPAL